MDCPPKKKMVVVERWPLVESRDCIISFKKLEAYTPSRFLNSTLKLIKT